MYNPRRYIIDWYTGDVVPEPNLERWAKWFERHHPCHVARTDLWNGITVSTIFLSLDHGMVGFPDYEPELFETMAYMRTSTKQEFEEEQWRYPTWERAAEGHIWAVAHFKRKLRLLKEDIRRIRN